MEGTCEQKYFKNKLNFRVRSKEFGPEAQNRSDPRHGSILYIKHRTITNRREPEPQHQRIKTPKHTQGFKLLGTMINKVEAKKLLKDKKLWLASFLIAWAAGLQVNEQLLQIDTYWYKHRNIVFFFTINFTFGFLVSSMGSFY